MGKRLLIGVICSGPQMERTSEVLKGIITQAFKTIHGLNRVSTAFPKDFTSVKGILKKCIRLTSEGVS